MALLDRAHGRRLHGGRDPPLLRPLRRHQGRRGLRDAVPRRVPARLRRRLVAAPGADRRSPRRSSRPTPTRSRSPRRCIEAIPDGRGVHMIDGKMQDDATWKQCKVMVDLAEMLAKKDPELAEAYEHGRSRVMRFFEYEAREIVKRAGIPVTNYGFATDRRGGAADRRANRRPDRDQVAGAHRRPDEGRRREVRRHARGGRGPRPRHPRARDQRPHAARRARRPEGRGRAGVLRRRRLGRDPQAAGDALLATWAASTSRRSPRSTPTTSGAGTSRTSCRSSRLPGQAGHRLDRASPARALNRLTPILARLARLFVENDMTLAEINPLGELEDGSFVALDAHMDMENEARAAPEGAARRRSASATRRPARRARRRRSSSPARRSTPRTTAAWPATSPSSTATSAS